MTTPKYPEITITLAGENGNAFSILGQAHRAMSHSPFFADWSDEAFDAEWDNYVSEATSGDYNHLLATTMKWFDCR